MKETMPGSAGQTDHENGTDYGIESVATKTNRGTWSGYIMGWDVIGLRLGRCLSPQQQHTILEDETLFTGGVAKRFGHLFIGGLG